MKYSIVKLSLLLSSLTAASHAVVVFTEDFSSIAPGGAINGLNATGDGSFASSAGNVTGNANNQAALVSDGGRDAIQINSTTQTSFGNLGFDIAFLGDTVVDPAVPASDTDIFFVQLTEGNRSTGGSPVSGFAHAIDASNLGISTVATSPSRANYFFNATAAPLNYTAPDGTTQTLAAGAFDFWVDTTQQLDGSSNTTNGTATPGFISTFVAQTFPQQEGQTFVFDNIELQDITVPEPSTSMVLTLGLLGFISKRKR